jgi:FlaG/FlaF family flagellin (archaellin)
MRIKAHRKFVQDDNRKISPVIPMVLIVAVTIAFNPFG